MFCEKKEKARGQERYLKIRVGPLVSESVVTVSASSVVAGSAVLVLVR